MAAENNGLPELEEGIYARLLNSRKYELKDHLGNVRALVSDVKKSTITNNTPGSYEPDVLTLYNYYPFGMEQPGRTWPANNKDYRYGFNGKEKDQNGEWGMTNYDYGFRIYNPAIGKFLSVDPLAPDFPWYTSYQFAGNTPIIAIDLDGLQPRGSNTSQSTTNQNSVLNNNRRGSTNRSSARFPNRVLTPPRPLTRVEWEEMLYGSPYNPRVLIFPNVDKGYKQYLENYNKLNGISNSSKRTIGNDEERYKELSEKPQENLTLEERNELISLHLFRSMYRQTTGFAKTSEIKKWEVKVDPDSFDKIDDIKKQIAEKGVGSLKEILVYDHNGELLLVDGHHRLAAALEMGAEHIPVKYLTRQEFAREMEKMGRPMTPEQLKLITDRVAKYPNVQR